MPPTKSSNSVDRSRSKLGRDTGERAVPQKLNLGCSTLLGGVCAIALLGKLLPHDAIRSVPAAKAEARKSEAGVPRIAALSKPRIASRSQPPAATEPLHGGAGHSRGANGERSIVFNNPWNGSVWQVERYLKRHLHDTTSFEALEWGQVVESAKGYQVRCKFRSKNVLGIYATQSKLFLLNKSGEVYAVRD